jgi:hypothetical protein
VDVLDQQIGGGEQLVSGGTASTAVSSPMPTSNAGARRGLGGLRGCGGSARARPARPGHTRSGGSAFMPDGDRRQREEVRQQRLALARSGSTRVELHALDRIATDAAGP